MNSLSTRKRIYTVLTYVALVALAIFFLFPLVFMFTSAFKQDEFQLMREMRGISAFLPSCTAVQPLPDQRPETDAVAVCSMGLKNFNDMLARIDFWRSFLNSSIVVAFVVMLGLIVNSMFAYALARIPFVGRNLLITLVISLIIIPFEAVAIPLMLMIYKIGLPNSYAGLIIPFIAHAFSIYLFYQFFISLPKELEEAAFVDGASRFRIYWQIILPLSGPVLATVAVSQFLAQWGQLLWPVMILQKPDLFTLPLAMQVFFGQYPRQWGDIMAFTAIATLPTLLMFLAFQRWFVRSAVSSAVKG